MPPEHRHYLEWTPERFQGWAAKIGPETERLVIAVMARYRHPALGYRSCLGILRLEQRYGAARLEAAAERTLSFGGASYKSVSHILQSGLDQKPRGGRLAGTRAPLSREPAWPRLLQLLKENDHDERADHREALRPQTGGHG